MSRYNKKHILVRKEFGKTVKRGSPLRIKKLLDGDVDRKEPPEIVNDMLKYSGQIVHLIQDYNFSDEKTRIRIQEDNAKYSWILRWFE